MSKRRSNKNRKKQSCLSVEVVKGIVHTLLFESKVPRKKLAKVLGIEIEELDRFVSQEGIGEGLITKVNLPLIEVYSEARLKSRGKKVRKTKNSKKTAT